jgi:hypothetical protein
MELHAKEHPGLYHCGNPNCRKSCWSEMNAFFVEKLNWGTINLRCVHTSASSMETAHRPSQSFSAMASIFCTLAMYGGFWASSGVGTHHSPRLKKLSFKLCTVASARITSCKRLLRSNETLCLHRLQSAICTASTAVTYKR